MTAQTRGEIARLLEEHGLAPIRRLGQHFLADANITRKIVELAGVGPGDQVVEIGAGTGTLTRALAVAGARVVAYEVDEGLRPVLEKAVEGLDVDLRFADAMRVDLASELGEGRWVMAANLPYNVGAPLVMGALRRAPAVDRFVVMVQREVAERLAARPGDPRYGLPSVVVGLHSTATVAFRVPPQVFIPRPRVESAVAVLDRKRAPANAERAVEIARATFGQRRKMLRRSLAAVMADPAAVLAAAGVAETARAEDVSPAQYLELAERS